MDVISYEYTKSRRDFGRHPGFSDSKPEIISLKRNIKDEKQWTLKRTSTVELDCIPEMSEHWVNTERFVQCHRGMQHTQGGWPKDVKQNDVQDRERFLRRIENLPQYAAAVRNLVRIAEKVIQQNETVDIYENYFDESDFEADSEPPSAKTCCVFRDRASSDVKRAATKITWHPDGASKLAVAYSILQFQQMPENMPLSSYIWDVNSPNEPDMEILPQSALSTLVYNPRSQDHMVGGSYNGLIGFWDLRKGKEAVDNSLIESSHRDPVYDIHWIQSRTGNECVSSSTDGQLLWWDVRKLSGGPTDSMQLRPNQGESVLAPGSVMGGSSNYTYGATCMEYRSDAGATRYLMGTEQGQLLLVDRKAKKDVTGDSTKQIKSIFGAESGKHHGPIYSVQRHPYAPKYFLTVGDWSARVWMEDLKTPILSTHYDRAYLTAGCWSPTRPGVFFTTKVDGTLDVWDYFYKHNDPVFSTKVGEQPLCSIKVHSQGKLLALGSQDGSTTVLEIGSSLSEQQPNEKQSILQMFERETKREKNLEIRLNQKKREANQERKKNTEVSTQGSSKSDEKLDALLKTVESDFFRLIEQKSHESAMVQAGGDKSDSAYEDDFEKSATTGGEPETSASPRNTSDKLEAQGGEDVVMPA